MTIHTSTADFFVNIDDRFGYTSNCSLSCSISSGEKGSDLVIIIGCIIAMSLVDEVGTWLLCQREPNSLSHQL